MRCAELFRRAAARLSSRNRKAPRGQILILAVIFIFMFLLVGVVLIDIYHVQEGRAWGYRVAQAGGDGRRVGDLDPVGWFTNPRLIRWRPFPRRAVALNRCA